MREGALMDWITRIAEPLQTQFNLVARAQGVQALGKDAFDARVQRGDLQRVQRGVHRPPHMPVPEEQAAMAAVLRCRPRAWLTGEALLGLFGVEGFVPTGPLRVLVPPERSVTGVTFTVLQDPHYRRHRATVRGIPAVTPARALADTAPFVAGEALRTVVDRVKWVRLTTNAKLRTTMQELPGHPGAELLLRLLEGGTLDVESPGERELQAVIAGFRPQPQYQVPILPGIRVDVAWWEVRLALDYDGASYHDRDTDRDRDEDRSLRIKRHGWEHVRIRKSMLRQPAQLAAAIAQLYNERAGRHGVPPLTATGF